MSRLRSSNLARTVFIVVLTGACAPSRAPQPGGQRGTGVVTEAALDESVRRDLERVRAATAAYKDIAAAQAAGFPTATPQCLEDPAQGGMGHHYVDRNIVDDRVEVERPEILLYAPTADGKLKLVAVEYIIPYARWVREDPPRIFGQPLRKSDPLQLWYLHVWAWQENSAGLFADWNPAVKCADARAR